MKHAQLPDKPSELIRLALADLARVEALPERYQVDMSKWHIGPADYDNGTDKCLVCLAGAVMSCTLGISAKLTVLPSQFGMGNSWKLEALNEFRKGHIYSAYSSLRRKLPESFDSDPWAPIISYEIDPAAFKIALGKMADALAAVGE